MSPVSRTIHFGAFELDVEAGELRKNGLRIRLGDQPLQVLTLLLEHAGQVVTREQLRQRLWSSDTFVDFEKGLNAAVKRLREALSDSAENPRFIETVPRHGYRFIVPVGSAVEPGVEPAAGESSETRSRHARPWWVGIVVLLVIGATIIPASRRLMQWLQPSAPSAIHSLAVLPLENLSTDPNQAYFSDGMTEALITELGKVRGLRVISRQSVMQYKGTTKTVPQIAKELKVKTVVEGSALLEGDKVRISVQLIRVKPEEHVWAQSYERRIDDVLLLQAEVAKAIVVEIQGQLTAQDQARLTTTRKVVPAAKLAFLREATRIDPSYAEAHAALATCYSLMAWSQPPKEIFPKVKAAARKSLQLDPTLGEGHVALGAAKLFFDWEWPDADNEFKLALDLNPSNALAHAWYSNLFLFTGHFDEAITEARKAVELDPASLLANRNLTFVYLLARRHDDAISQANATLALDPTNLMSQCDIAWAYLLKGSKEQAVAQAARFGLADHPFFVPPAKRKQALARIDHDRYRRENASAQYVDSFYIAMQYAHLAEKDLAFQWLEKAYEDRSAMMVQLKVSPDLDGLRSDSRFSHLLRRMNFPP